MNKASQILKGTGLGFAFIGVIFAILTFSYIDLLKIIFTFVAIISGVIALACLIISGIFKEDY